MLSALGSGNDRADAQDGRDGRDSSRRRRRLNFSLRELQAVYHLPLKLAAQRLGICEAALKRICRRHRILKWPYRQLSSVQRRIADLQASQRMVADLGRADDHLRRDELRLDIHAHQASKQLHIYVDVHESPKDQARGQRTASEAEEAKIRALIDEHRRIVRSAHLDSDTTCLHAEALHPVRTAAPRTALPISVPSSSPALLALASACELHADSRQHSRPYQGFSYQTARLLGLVAPDDSSLRDFAVVAASAPRAQQHIN